MNNKVLKIFYYYGDKPIIEEDRVKELYVNGSWITTTLLAHEELDIKEDKWYIDILFNTDSIILRDKKYKINHIELKLESPKIIWIQLEEILDETKKPFINVDSKYIRPFGQEGNENDELEMNQIRFVNEFIKDFNDTEAAIRAGYHKQTATANSITLLSKRKIIKAIEKAKFDELKIE